MRCRADNTLSRHHIDSSRAAMLIIFATPLLIRRYAARLFVAPLSLFSMLDYAVERSAMPSPFSVDYSPHAFFATTFRRHASFIFDTRLLIPPFYFFAMLMLVTAMAPLSRLMPSLDTPPMLMLPFR